MEEEIKKYVVKNLNYSLAVENYEDDTGKTNEIIENVWKLLKEYRMIKDSLSKEKELSMVKEISKKFDLAVSSIGKENFIFYSDGNINYIWKGDKKMGRGNNRDWGYASYNVDDENDERLSYTVTKKMVV